MEEIKLGDSSDVKIEFCTASSSSSSTNNNYEESSSSPTDCYDDDNIFSLIPSAYRFRPYDEELIKYYLQPKVANEKLPPNKIRDVHLYKHNPEYLAGMYDPLSENEWYFFTPRDKKYKNGDRPNRAAGDGYWKATGADIKVEFNGEVIGYRKTLIFYRGKPPKGVKTEWVMHEYVLRELEKKKRDVNDTRLDDWVLCKIHKKGDRKMRAPTRQRLQGGIQKDSKGKNTNNDSPISEDESGIMDQIGADDDDNDKYNNTNILTLLPPQIHDHLHSPSNFDNVHYENLGVINMPRLLPTYTQYYFNAGD